MKRFHAAEIRNIKEMHQNGKIKKRLQTINYFSEQQYLDIKRNPSSWKNNSSTIEQELRVI